MEEISLDFHCFKALNNNLEAQLFYMLIFMPHHNWELGTVLIYAFKPLACSLIVCRSTQQANDIQQKSLIELIVS